VILVDSSVWIDLFGDRQTLQTLALRAFIAERRRILVGDLILTEVLQGARTERTFEVILGEMALFDRVQVADAPGAIQAARNYRHLRSLGITPRKTIDTLIATRCILDGIPLLYADRDFDPFVQHLGLRSALDIPGVTP
jgi:predicted nucleic acid-binding protein